MIESELESSKALAHQYVGEYTVNFQKIVFQLQNLIRWTFRFLGLEQPQIINIFFADRSANDILVLARGVFNQVYTLSESEKKITEKLFKRISDVIEQRNDLLHGQMFIGVQTNDEGTSFYMHKERIKKTKEGLKHTYSPASIEELKSQATEAYTLASSVFQLHAYFTEK
ncbi:MAG: hypothetical protein Q8S22_00795 [Eubacteriales bacterium]|jgi:hypothetical protein|nr:hypothetical protein [Eubacteriales bacterium]